MFICKREGCYEYITGELGRGLITVESDIQIYVETYFQFSNINMGISCVKSGEILFIHTDAFHSARRW